MFGDVFALEIAGAGLLLDASVPNESNVECVCSLAPDLGEAIDAPASAPSPSLLDLYKDGESVSLSRGPALVGVELGLSGLVLLAEDRGVILAPKLLIGVAPSFCKRGESIGAGAGADLFVTEGDGVDRFVGFASRGAGEERRELVVAGSLGISGGGGGDARLLRSRADIAQGVS